MNVTMLVYILIAANVLFSWQAFSNQALFENFKFRVGNILSGKEYVRLLSSAFLHADWTHLIVNMIALYSFGIAMGYSINTIQFAALYFVSLFAGNLLALFFNKGNFNYSAVGASGAVSGVVFASVLFYPFGKVLLFFFLPMPSWVFGILYLLYSVYGMNKQNDNIGHEAHLGGAVAGVLMALVFQPSLAMENWWLTAALLLIPMIIFFIRPKSAGGGYEFTILNDNQSVKRTKRSVDDLYYNKEFEREKELNELLEKLNVLGIDSLTAWEKNRLHELSN
jgi:membrane associated rhomboid family serine protease